MTGQVCGVILHHPSEKKLYVTGDTVWYERVQEVLEKNKRDIIYCEWRRQSIFTGGFSNNGKG